MGQTGAVKNSPSVKMKGRTSISQRSDYIKSQNDSKNLNINFSRNLTFDLQFRENCEKVSQSVYFIDFDVNPDAGDSLHEHK